MLKYCGRWKFVRNLYLSIRYWVVGKKFVPYRDPITKYQAVKLQNILPQIRCPF
jgi:hypothetical protein